MSLFCQQLLTCVLDFCLKNMISISAYCNSQTADVLVLLVYCCLIVLEVYFLLKTMPFITDYY